MEFDKLASIIAEVMNIDVRDMDADTSFLDDLGADSLDLFQILIRIEEELQIEINPEEAEKVRTVGDVLDLIGRSV